MIEEMAIHKIEGLEAAIRMGECLSSPGGEARAEVLITSMDEEALLVVEDHL
jgi:hypothetical protein